MTTTEEVIRLARESGFVLFDNATDEAITRFKCLVDLVRAEENEACAKTISESSRPTTVNEVHIKTLALNAIRARRNHG